jgi:hypothetical protein
MAQNRVAYSVYAVGFAKLGTTTFTPVRGLQSVTLNTNFNLEDVFEIGQSNTYAIIEDLPDIQVSMQKKLDGFPLIYHLATNGATLGSISGRSNVQTIMALSIFNDVQDNASGTPLTQCECSGLFYNGGTWTFPADGDATEDANLVGNNKVYKSSSFTFAGATLNSIFTGNDAPAYGSTVRRQHFDWGTSRVPKLLPGISSSGTNDADSNGFYKCSVQNVSVSFDLGRQSINELGHKGPYFRYPNPIVEVTSTFEVVSKSGDITSATEAGILGYGYNLLDETILIKTLESTQLNLGSKNKCQSVSQGGGDTGGGLQTLSFTFVNKNSLVCTHSSDPSGL